MWGILFVDVMLIDEKENKINAIHASIRGYGTTNSEIYGILFLGKQKKGWGPYQVR